MYAIVYLKYPIRYTVARIDQGSTRLIFWDLGGQDDLQSLWDKVQQTVIYITMLPITVCHWTLSFGMSPQIRTNIRLVTCTFNCINQQQ